MGQYEISSKRQVRWYRNRTDEPTNSRTIIDAGDCLHHNRLGNFKPSTDYKIYIYISVSDQNVIEWKLSRKSNDYVTICQTAWIRVKDFLK